MLESQAKKSKSSASIHMKLTSLSQHRQKLPLWQHQIQKFLSKISWHSSKDALMTCCHWAKMRNRS
jgi:hypothetical protein